MRRAAVLVSVAAATALAVGVASPAAAVTYGTNRVDAQTAYLDQDATVGDWLGVNATVSRSTAWSASGVGSLALTSPTSSASYARTAVSVEGGKSYRVRAQYQSTYVLTGTLHADSRRVTIWHGGAKLAETDQAPNTTIPNAPGTPGHPISGTFTVPGTGTQLVEIRAVWGSATVGQNVRFDSVEVNEILPDVTDPGPVPEVTVEVPRPTQAEIDSALESVAQSVAWGYGLGLAFVAFVLVVARTSERG
jgi:hypothetical protein